MPKTNKKSIEINCRIDANGGGTRFDGVGSVSAASVSRFFVEYPEHAKQDITRMLFEPGTGASLHELKVEIGSDINSSSGTEACHCRTKAEYDDMIAHIDDPGYAPNIERFTRGYEWEVMNRAKSVNPKIKFHAMPFAAPEWCTGDGAHQIANERWLDYLVSFLHGALTYHNISFNYIALRNEIHDVFREWPGDVIVRYKKRLDEFNRKYNQNVKLVGPDGGGGNGVGGTSFAWVNGLEKDPNYCESIYAYAEHYLGWTVDPEIQKIQFREKNPVLLWDTEDQASYNIPPADFKELNGEGALETEWDRALHYARIINRNYANARVTKTLFVNLIGSYYKSNYSGCWLLTANQPWTGWYDICPCIFTVAHTTQATEPGWKYLDGGCKVIKDKDKNGGGNIIASVVTYMDPGNKNDYSIIIETADADSPVTIHFDKPAGVSGAPLNIWTTSRTELFKFQGRQSTGGENGFDIIIPPQMIYTLTTRTDLNHGGPVHEIPAPGSFPLPYSDDFDSYNGYNGYKSRLPRYFTDMVGAFEVVDGGMTENGKCVEQSVRERTKNQYLNMSDNYFPVTYIGDHHWTDYEVSAYVKIGEESVEGCWAGIIGRAFSDGSKCCSPDCYMLYLHRPAGWSWGPQATWRFAKEKSGRRGDELHQIIFADYIADIDWNKWYKLKLKFDGNSISAWVGDNLVVDDYKCDRDIFEPYAFGMAGLASGYNTAYFDDFKIDRLESSPPAALSYVKKIDFNNYNIANSFKNSDIPGAPVKLGMKFKTKQNILITEIGRFWINRNKRPHKISVYDAKTLELKGSAVINMDNPENPGEPNFASHKMDYFNGFVYESSHIRLDPGEYYIVSDEITGGGDKWYGGDFSIPVITPADSGAFDGEIFGVKCFGDPQSPSSWEIADAKSGNCYGPVNFKFLIL